MEVVREIISISHDGYKHMWSPLYIENELHCKFINCFSIGEGLQLVELVRTMFATNNHNSKKTSDFLINYIHPNSLNNNTQCSIEFKTERGKYILTRVLVDNYSIETKLISEASRTVLFGQNAIQKLRKITSPISINEVKSYNSSSLIFKPDCESSRINMMKMTERWSKILDCSKDLTYKLSSRGEWGVFDTHNRKYNTLDMTTPSIVSLLSSLSQATIRTRKFGYCPAIVCSVNVEDLNKFEIMRLVELVSNICIEERLNLLITIHYHGKIDDQFIVNTSTM